MNTETILKSYYFTFGTNPLFPYGVNDYVEVRARNRKECAEKFKQIYPNRDGSNLLNCAFVYEEDEWNRIYNEYYKDKKPVRIIE